MNTTSEQEATCATAELAVRELDRRTNDGIEVRLLWNPQTNRVSVAVRDGRAGESFQLEVDAAGARTAFHHPYAYATTAARTAIAACGPNESEHPLCIVALARHLYGRAFVETSVPQGTPPSAKLSRLPVGEVSTANGTIFAGIQGSGRHDRVSPDSTVVSISAGAGPNTPCR